jgi:hypothetical protein
MNRALSSVSVLAFLQIANSSFKDASDWAFPFMALMKTNNNDTTTVRPK